MRTQKELSLLETAPLIEASTLIFGRNKELERLNHLVRSASESRTLQHVFICGPSGSGKSFLVKSFLSNVTGNYLHGWGKFEELEQMPFAAIARFLASIVSPLAAEKQMTRQLCRMFDSDDKRLLMELCSELNQIFQEDEWADDKGEGGAKGDEEMSNGRESARSSFSSLSVAKTELGITDTSGFLLLKNLLRILMKQLTSERTLIFVLDDLQWMDESSHELLQHLLEDPELKSLIFIGLYRSVGIAEWTKRWIDDIADSVRLTLDPLTLPCVEDLLIASLNRNDVHELATLVHSKTGGNPFCVWQLLGSLQSTGLIKYSPSTLKWTWDEEQIRQSATMAADFASSQIVADRLLQLPLAVQLCLQSAACIGPRFDMRMLGSAMAASTDAHDGSGVSSIDFERAIRLNLVEETPEGVCHFTHDQIYEACLSLRTSLEEREALHLAIGKALSAEFDLKDTEAPNFGHVDDPVLFACANQFNRGRRLLLRKLSSQEGTREALLSVRLNLEAGERCTHSHAYTSAKLYLELGMELLNAIYMGRDPWIENTDICLRFATRLSEVYLCCGAVDLVPDLVKLSLANAPDKDTFRLRYSYLKALHMTNQITVLVDQSLELLEGLGEMFHKLPSDYEVAAEQAAILKRLASISDDEILGLRRLKDNKKHRVLQILAEILASVQYFSKYQGLTRLVQLRMLSLTLDYGISKWAPDSVVYASYAFFHDEDKLFFDTYIRLANLALKLAKKLGGMEWRSHVVVDGLVFRHWTEPIVANVDDAFFVYEQDLKRGKIDAAFHAASLYIYSYYFSGLNLQPFLRDLKAICSVQWEYGAHLRILHMLPLYQVVLNLAGQSKNILDMYNGEAMEYRTKIGWRNRDGEIAQWSYSLALYVYCQEWEKANEMYDNLIDKDIGFLRSFPIWHNRVFFFAIVSIHNAKTSKRLLKRKFTRSIENHMQLMRRWVTERNAINLVHKLQILEAMQLTLLRPYPPDDTLIASFEKAILVASRSGYFHDAGLAASLASWAIRDRDKRLDYASFAIGAYRKWGAEGLVQHLESTSVLYRTASQFDGATPMETGTWRSRQRFEESTAAIRELLER